MISPAPFRTRIAIGATALAAATLLWGCMGGQPEPRAGDRAAALTADLSSGGFARLTAAMDPAMLSLAKRHGPDARKDLWGRTIGWETLNLDQVPDLGLDTDVAETASEINDLRPFSQLPIKPMRPFRLVSGGTDADRALKCLAEAVYYESAREPQLGREAVAQVVLNRVRHPAYPKSVCAVVYQGSARTTGCQFSFTCDGSLRYAPEPDLWRQAREIARRALNGHVVKAVGSATHYHASYVAPYWAPTLVKMKQVGLHIFYRWTGPWGEPAAFTGRYVGREAYISPAILGGIDQRTQGLDPEREGMVGGQKVTLAVAGEVRTYTVADSSAVGGERTRVLGALYPSRRKPTAAEIREINESLAAIAEPEGPASKAVPAPVASQDGGALQ